MTAADFWQFFPSPLDEGSLSANGQTSPGNAPYLHAYIRRIYFRDFRTGIGL
jgi:hypothetical protein